VGHSPAETQLNSPSVYETFCGNKSEIKHISNGGIHKYISE